MPWMNGKQVRQSVFKALKRRQNLNGKKGEGVVWHWRERVFTLEDRVFRKLWDLHYGYWEMRVDPLIDPKLAKEWTQLTQQTKPFTERSGSTFVVFCSCWNAENAAQSGEVFDRNWKILLWRIKKTSTSVFISWVRRSLGMTRMVEGWCREECHRSERRLDVYGFLRWQLRTWNSFH